MIDWFNKKKRKKFAELHAKAKQIELTLVYSTMSEEDFKTIVPLLSEITTNLLLESL